MIHLGIIGAGEAVRRLHWPVLKQMSGIRVVAVASRTLAKARACARLCDGARAYSDYRQLLQDPGVDAVLIAVPIHLNARVLIDSVRAGKHTLAEKPLAATRKEGRLVLNACAQARGVVVIAENFRYREDLGMARRILAAGKIGEVKAFQVTVLVDLDSESRRAWMERPWRKDPKHLGGFLLDHGVHVMSGMSDVLGEVDSVFAQVADPLSKIRNPESLFIQISLKNGAVGHYFSWYRAKVKEETAFKLAVYGSRGSLEVENGKVTWTDGSSVRPHIFTESHYDRGYRRQWQNFCRAIRGEEAVVSTPDKAYRDLLLVDAALYSARCHHRVRLP